MITDNGWQAASFVLALMTWRRTRPDGPQVTIRRGDVEVTVPSGNPEEAARIASLLQQATPTAPVDDASRDNSQLQDAASDRAVIEGAGDGGTSAGDDGEGREG